MNDSSSASSWISLRDSSMNSLVDNDDDLQMFMDALEQYNNDEDDEAEDISVSISSTIPSSSGGRGGGGVCFHDTVQELSASGHITHSPLKDHHDAAQGSRENPFQTLLASLPNDAMQNPNDSGSLQSLNLLEEEEEEPLDSNHSSVGNSIRDAIQQAWSSEDDDDTNHPLSLEHSASQQQRHNRTILPRARHPNLTLQ
jgi:hypothetical protein